MSLTDKFTKHPATVGETYGEHFVAAMGFSVAMLKAALCCALHAVFPFLCERTGSRCIEDLHTRMVVNRARAATDERGNRRARGTVGA
ncbi:MAG TPA: DUF6356 family protein [Woeseiaceae bacterium]|nr:DUF6356 family protein [Woeseiaceae bacterium]